MGPYSIMRESPTTAVGIAMGRSMRARNIGFPGKEYLVMTNAMRVPATMLIQVAISAIRSEFLKAVMASSEVTASMNSDTPSPNANLTIDPRGMRIRMMNRMDPMEMRVYLT